jgi:predicted MFS family arabinose efflux permease
MYGLAAAAMLLLNGLLRHELPREPTRASLSYTRLLRTALLLLRDEPVLRRRAVYGALGFAAFGIFWTSIAFLLAQPPFGYSQAVIGLFGLAGAAGALGARPAGRLVDRGLAAYTTTSFMLLILISFAVLAAGSNHVVPIVIGVVTLDLGVQGLQITNQSVIYQLRGEARSRITTAYMTVYFLGGAAGSAASATIYQHAGWSAVCALGALVAALALLLWLAEWGFKPLFGHR